MKTLISILFLTLFLSACGRSPESQARKGIEALNKGANSKAQHHLVKAAEKSTGNVAATNWALAGLAAARAGKGGDAEAYFRLALEGNPESFEANYNLGTLLTQQDRYDEAIPYLEQAVRSEGERTEALEALSGIALRQQEYDMAVEYLQQAAARQENVRVLTRLAVAGQRNFTVEESRELLQRAATLDPGYAPAQLNLAALLDQNRLAPTQAATHYQSFLRIRPEDDKVPLIRQRLQIMQQRDASGDYSRSDPLRQEVEAFLAQATQDAEAGDPVGALQNCLRANAVATRAQRSDLQERALRAAATLVPDSARAQFGLGQFLLNQNRKTEAMVSLEKARDLAPGWPMTLRPTILLAADLDLVTAGRAMLQEAEQAGAANPAMLLEIGDLYAEAFNNDRESKRVYRGILETFPDFSERAVVEERLER